MKFKQIKKIISKAKTIALFTHTSPDADGVCSCVALSNAIQFFNKNAVVQIYCEKIPNELKFLNVEEKILTNITDLKYDLLISLDTGSANQLGSFKEYFLNHKNTIEMDHHFSRDSFAKFSYVDSSKSSMCEILFQMFEELNVKLNKEIATNLYAGIAADTGCFNFNNTSSYTHFVASMLMKYNIDIYQINNNLFNQYTKQEFDLLRLILNNTKIEKDFAYSIIDSKQLNQNKISEPSSRNAVNKLLAIESINMSAVAIEKESGKFYISLRAKLGEDCSLIAKELGGGGHKLASGCKIEGDKNTVKIKLLRSVREYKERN